ncbi:MAG: DNA adenine methylase [Alphaproteobacteria bacterium]|nr:DNA adenine methylase [Alphaproteobacteria bacterium]
MESIPFDRRAVEPVRPLAPWIGGKRNLAKRLTATIDAVEGVALYAEPFLGMGGVFLRRRTRPRAEAVNDWNRDVATLFRVVQRHYQAFVEMIRWQLATRADFDRLVRTDPETLTDLERAARFLYIARTCFGGRAAKPSFGVSPGRPSRFDVTKVVPLLEDVHARLAGVTIECLPYADFIARYDRADTLFYLDPPYIESEGDYGRDLFGREDFARLAGQLGGLRGRFILSINDHPLARELFAGFEIEAAQTTYSIGVKGGRASGASELIIRNFAA